MFAFEAPSFGASNALHEAGSSQGAPSQQRLRDQLELVPAEVSLGLVESRGAGQLSYRELGDSFCLARGAGRLLALGLMEAGFIIGVDDQRRAHRADRQDGDCGEAKPEAKAHAPIVGRRCHRVNRRAPSFARDRGK